MDSVNFYIGNSSSWFFHSTDDSQEDRNKSHQVEVKFKMRSKDDLKN